MRSARRVMLALFVGVLALTAACTNTPPPPLVKKPPPTPVVDPEDAHTVVVGLADVSGGFNPHLLADRSTVTSALAPLLLPSVFRPATDGTPQLDRTVMESAAVTSSEPFTVTYRLRTDASWSDGVPVAAEDFEYLRDQLTTQPGVADPAGYGLISGISAEENGKVVRVSFERPYPGWRSLFTDLLPAHLLKDAPGGWVSAMAENFPAVAGPFSIKQADLDRGQVTLQRNERYWAEPTKLDELVFRQSNSSDAVAALDSGDSQVASLPATDSTAKAFDAGVNPSELVPRQDVAELVLRQDSSVLSDVRVRRAVAYALDRDALIVDAVGEKAQSRLRADAMVTAPSQPGYRATMPAGAPGAKRNLRATARLLRAAGYEKGDDAWFADGKRLTLRIAAPAVTGPYVALARAVSTQLREAGIETTLSTPNPVELFGDRLTRKDSADLVLAPRPVGLDPTTTLAQSYGCSVPGAAVPRNPAGFCDNEVQQIVDDALSGEIPLRQALSTVEPKLWRSAVAVPLFQLGDDVAASPGVSGVRAGRQVASPFPSAPGWRRELR